MNTYEEKKSLLSEMIAFSTVEGHLNKKEYEFLFLIANELNIEKGGFNDLFQQELPKLPINNELQRIQHFYKLALLMHSDGTLQIKESIAIKEIGVRMGLNSEAIKRILTKMEKSPKTIISADVLKKIFKEERN
ncbi:excinuclease ABC subunit B [Flavobacterium sp. W22_SRS_FP1]|uniref:excinuclease ABC subunit B n=1 Tax=Flavobacterium sp. W22_SRS_FP1 TaxID=3240276 RepID=UPI003F93DF99